MDKILRELPRNPYKKGVEFHMKDDNIIEIYVPEEIPGQTIFCE